MRLHEARTRGEVEEAVAAEADVNERTETGNTPMHIAATLGLPDVVDALLEHGATVDLRNAHGKTALVSAVTIPTKDPAMQRRLERCVRLLAEAGADLEARSADGFTPLHVAIRTRWPGMARLLLGLGADPRATIDRGLTPLQLAIEKALQDGKSLEMVTTLLAYGLEGESEADLWLALCSGARFERRRPASERLVVKILDRLIATGFRLPEDAIRRVVSLRRPDLIRALAKHGAAVTPAAVRLANDLYLEDTAAVLEELLAEPE